MSEPCSLNPMLTFFLSLGIYVRSCISKRAKHQASMRKSVDSVYVLYVVTAGKIEDLSECLISL
jgi:hypothetical protein